LILLKSKFIDFFHQKHGYSYRSLECFLCNGPLLSLKLAILALLMLQLALVIHCGCCSHHSRKDILLTTIIALLLLLLLLLLPV